MGVVSGVTYQFQNEHTMRDGPRYGVNLIGEHHAQVASHQVTLRLSDNCVVKYSVDSHTMR